MTESIASVHDRLHPKLKWIKCTFDVFLYRHSLATSIVGGKYHSISYPKKYSLLLSWLGCRVEPKRLSNVDNFTTNWTHSPNRSTTRNRQRSNRIPNIARTVCDFCSRCCCYTAMLLAIQPYLYSDGIWTSFWKSRRFCSLIETIPIVSDSGRSGHRNSTW